VQPVRIKVYGLVPMTRRRYLTQLAVAVVLALVLLGLWWFLWPGRRAQLLSNPSPARQRVGAAVDAVPWVILAVAGAQAVEAWFVLRRFARKEAAREGPQVPKPA
jgi:hypothetical protein